jgi:hypothetical protein
MPTSQPRSILPAGLMLFGIGQCCSIGGAGTFGTNPDDDRPARREGVVRARAEEDRALMIPLPVAATGGFVADSLRIHLPPTVTARKFALAERLVITPRASSFFGGDSCDITVMGNFTPERIKDFVEHARRLRGSSDRAPTFLLHFWRDPADGRTFVADLELT